MINTPHFDLPFRWGVDGHAVTTEQDSLEDISNCVQAIVLTRVGEREESPGFGITDPVFGVQPLDLGPITEAILEQEPRAALHLDQGLDGLIAAKINIDLSINAGGER